ncbi:MAG: hypothetical protein H6581_15330 [Bacteroidia bacterium]|nr:hypothetical protein [Bacteroidia bacterium]
MKKSIVFLGLGGMLLVGMLGLSATSKAPDSAKKGKFISLGFYNVENLFDLADDPNKNDNEFLPEGTYKWTPENYVVKLGNLARAISDLGDPDGPELLGLAEVENRTVIEDLIATPALEKGGYDIVHAESPDDRGIDVALIYKKKYFRPLVQKSLRVAMADVPDFKTRDILMVKGIFGKKDTVHIFVNHWPSRRGGEAESSPKRELAASVLKSAVDSLLQINSQAKIAIMGDFNDDPNNKSLNEVLQAAPLENLKSASLINLMYNMEAETGMGTLMYQRQWNLFDQVILSKAFFEPKSKSSTCIPQSAGIHHPEWMEVADGDWKGAPRRSYIRGEFLKDGCSDHFPVFVHLTLPK